LDLLGLVSNTQFQPFAYLDGLLNPLDFAVIHEFDEFLISLMVVTIQVKEKGKQDFLHSGNHEIIGIRA
jgi:hypothetical protein